jgi:cytochrome c biogenesis protein CcdA
MSGELILLSAVGFGFAHAFEPDHMAAVSTFVASRPSPKEALSFGLKWASGHGISLIILGSTLYLFKRAIEEHQPALFSSGILEQVVGAVLVVLGLNALLRVLTGSGIPTNIKGWKALFSKKNQSEQSLETQIIEQQMAAKRLAPTENNGTASHPIGHHHHLTTPVASSTNSLDENSAKAKTVNAVVGGSVLMGLLHGAAGTGAFIGQAAVSMSSDFGAAMLYTLLFSIGVLIAMGFYAVTLGGFFTLGARKSFTILRSARIMVGALTVAIGVCLIRGIALPGVFDAFISH